MGTGGVLFVHGAGNRKPDAEAYGEKIRAGLKVPADRFSISNWGDATGPKLDRIDATMPDEPAAAFGGDTAALLADPYSALRALPRQSAGAFAVTDRDAETVLAFLQLGGQDLSELGIPAEHLAASAAEVAVSPEFVTAGGDPTERIDAAVTAAVARSIQRQALPAQPAGAFGIDLIGAAKSAIAKMVIGSGALSVVGDWLGPKLGPPAALWVSQQLAPKRKQIMRERMLVAADVLYYQRHGHLIRDHVRDEIANLPEPRLVIGHSLGGIVLVDALFGPGPAAPNIALLVTFGSQAAFLAAIGALDTVQPSAPWLNIWTRYDFVSFLGDGMWPGQVTDRPVDIEVGFPESHGEYYNTAAFYTEIASHPAAASVLG